jgi:Mg-chelatase subunit ChlI
VTKPVFTSVETQTDITWLNKADKPTRLMVKNTEKIVNSSKKVTNSSQTTSSSRTTTTSDSKSSTSSNFSSHQNKKEQKPKAQNRSLSQRQSKSEKDHNRYGRLDDARSAWTSNVISIKLTFRPPQFHWMIEAIMGVGSGGCCCTHHFR